MTIRSVFSTCFILSTAVLAAEEATPGHSYHGESFNEGPRQQAYLMDTTGDISFPVSTKNEKAQAFFNQGVGQLHGFWYFEAERSFRQVLHLDPTCQMAYWGLAMSNVNNGKRAKEFMKEVEEALESERLTERERLYLKSLHRFYHGGEKDTKKRYRELVRDYEDIALRFSEDIEARALAAQQIWYNGRKGLPVSSHLSVDAMIQQVLDAKPMHPVHHYKIHLWDNERVKQALPSAARCGQSAPGIAHMWHMPGHTYSKTHRYEDAVYQQSASGRVDHAHMMRDHVMPHKIHNYAHNNGWCAENLGFLGRIDEAISLAVNLLELPRPAKFKKLGETEYYDAGGTPFSEGRKRLWALLNDYALWDELLRLSETSVLAATDDPLMQANRYRYRGMAYFYKGELEQGRGEIAALEEFLSGYETQRDEAGEAAKTKAEEKQKDEEDEKKRDEAIKKAEKGARKPYDSIVKACQSYKGHLEAHLAVLTERPKVAREKLDKAKGLLAIDKARLHMELANWEKAAEILKREVDGKRNPVVMKSNYIRTLKQLGEKDTVKREMESLRKLAATADVESPPMVALSEIAKELEFPEDWRLAQDEQDDLIDRPDLDDLGPFRWSPSAAPEWQFSQANGEVIDSTKFSNKPVLVIYYLGRGCAHCMEQLNAFAPEADKYREAGIEIVAVSTDTVEGLAKTFQQGEGENPFPFPLVSDAENVGFKAFRAYDEFEDQALHGTFLVDGTGKIRWQDVSYEPFMHASWLLEESERLLATDAVIESLVATK
ncbi:MAG: redoxin domain-containing protein [Verrucomicrobiales bacterium]|nr:redoxin domain-containing protein [Verrucomicrobiales bacterium]